MRASAATSGGLWNEIVEEAFGPGAAGAEAVVGGDNRARVRDATRPPYRWVCALDLFNPYPDGQVRRDRGSGVLISPRHVLTSAHNVHPKAGVTVQRIEVTPALDGARWLGRSPVGKQKVHTWYVDPTYKRTRQRAWDFALLTLPTDFPVYKGATFGYWSDARFAPRTRIQAVTPAGLADARVTVSGYPSDRCGTRACLACQPASLAQVDAVRGRRSWASTQWEASGAVVAGAPAGLIRHDVDTCVGQSGSPVWVPGAGGAFDLVAIHAGRAAGVNEAVPLTAQLLNLLRAKMLRDGVRAKF